jgi:hypothetical protein
MKIKNVSNENAEKLNSMKEKFGIKNFRVFIAPDQKSSVEGCIAGTLFLMERVFNINIKNEFGKEFLILINIKNEFGKEFLILININNEFDEIKNIRNNIDNQIESFINMDVF